MRGTIRFSVIAAILFAGVSIAHAVPGHLNNFKATYPNVVGTKLDSCTTCHNPDFTRNSYGLDFAGSGHNFGAIENTDSDGDGATNIAEINALTFPGDPADHPASASPSPAPPASPSPGPVPVPAAGEVIPEPVAQDRLPYDATAYPLLSSDPLKAMPIGLGDVATGGEFLSVQIGLDAFLSPTDLYIAYTVPTDPLKVFFMGPDYSVAAYSLKDVIDSLASGRLPDGIRPWKTGSTGPVNEIILNNIPTASLASGSYAYYVIASARGDLSRYYLWGTSFENEAQASVAFGGAKGSADKAPLLMAGPETKVKLPFEPTTYPVLSNKASDARPFGIGPIAEGGNLMSLQVGLGKFVRPMDLYLAYSLPVEADRVYFMKPDYSVQSYSMAEVAASIAAGRMPQGIEPWKKSSTGLINEIIINNVPISQVNAGAYAYYLLASPAGTMDRYYLWGTEFETDGGAAGAINPFVPQSIILNGTALYNQHCAICHGGFSSTEKAGMSGNQIQSAIGKIPLMNGLKDLRPDQVKAIGDALMTLAPQTTLDGTALYTTYCSGCHGALGSSAKAGSSSSMIISAIGNPSNPAMNSATLKGLTQAQINAIAGVLAGSAPSQPTVTMDGPTLYTTYCSGCHGALATSAKSGRTAAQIQTAISGNAGGMMGSGTLMALNATQVQAIATALATSAPSQPTVTMDGPTLYTTYCSGCHGALATSAKSGRTAAQIQAAISGNAGGVMGSVTLTALSATQVQAIATALATGTPAPAPSPHPANWYTAHRNYAESNGTTTCQACHGADLRGGSGPSCYTCHGKVW